MILETTVSWDLEVMLRKNLGVALFLFRKYAEAEHELLENIAVHKSIHYDHCGRNNNKLADTSVCHDLIHSELFVQHKVYLLRRSTCKWQEVEYLTHTLIQSSIISATKIIDDSTHSTLLDVQAKKYKVGEKRDIRFFDGPFLPFDTLSVEMSLEERFIIARAFALGYERKQRSILLLKDICVDESCGRSSGRNVPELRLGFISFDFNDHPTAYMIEGLFRAIKSVKTGSGERHEGTDVRHFVHTTVFSYGKDDGSQMRRISELLPDEFVELADKSYKDSELEIQLRNLSVLIDLQVRLN